MLSRTLTLPNGFVLYDAIQFRGVVVGTMSATTYLCKGMLTLDPELRLRESCVKARWNSRLTTGERHGRREELHGGPSAKRINMLKTDRLPLLIAGIPEQVLMYRCPVHEGQCSSPPRRTTRPSGRVSAWPLWRTALAGQDEWKSGCLPRIKPALCYVRS